MRISEFFDPAYVFLELDARSKDEALEMIGRRLQDIGAVRNAREFIDLVREREAQGGTAIGQGIAIPHARSRSLSRILVALARLKAGIDFDAEDGEPVRLIFLIGTPQDQSGEYLKFLGGLSKALKSNGLARKLTKARTVEDVLALLEDSC